MFPAENVKGAQATSSVAYKLIPSHHSFCQCLHEGAVTNWTTKTEIPFSPPPPPPVQPISLDAISTHMDYCNGQLGKQRGQKHLYIFTAQGNTFWYYILRFNFNSERTATLGICVATCQQFQYKCQ